MLDETGTPASTETEETEEVETVETPEQEEGETVDEYKARLQKAEELAENYKKRAEKAERAAKGTKPVAEDGSLSSRDVIYLSKADIHEDDMDEVLEWSKFKKISVKEAHESLKDVLKGREAERRTAAATQTGGGRRATSAATHEAILRKAAEGELPKGEQDISKLAEARMAERLARKE